MPSCSRGASERPRTCELGVWPWQREPRISSASYSSQELVCDGRSRNVCACRGEACAGGVQSAEEADWVRSTPSHPHTLTRAHLHPHTCTLTSSHPKMCTLVPSHVHSHPLTPSLLTHAYSHPHTCTLTCSHPKTCTLVPSHPHMCIVTSSHPPPSLSLRLCCISPVLGARVLPGVELTVGREDDPAANAITAMGATHVPTSVSVSQPAQSQPRTTPGFQSGTALAC